MTDLLELGGFYGDLAGEQVVHSTCSLSDFAPLRETLFFVSRKDAKTQRKKDRS